MEYFLQYAGMEMTMQTGNGEDLMTLEQEITELQRENARVESQMMRLKSDINAMETHLSHGERVSAINFLKHPSNFLIILVKELIKIFV